MRCVAELCSQKTLTRKAKSLLHLFRIIQVGLCVKQGTKYALVAEKNVYTLEGHEAELDKYAAQKVTVKGTLKGQSLTVESVIPAK